MVNAYELMLIFRTDTSEEKRKKTIDELKKLLSSANNNAEVKDFGKRQLAFPIRKENSGNFYYLTLIMEGKEVSPINTKLKLNEDILRFLLTKIEITKKVKKEKGERK